MSLATYGPESNSVVQNTTRQMMLESQKFNNNGHAPRDLLGYRSNTQSARSADMRTTQHKPAPSPLHTSAMTADSHANDNPSVSRSPTTSSAASAAQHSSSPHTPSPSFAPDQDQPNISRDRVGPGTATESVVTENAPGQSGVSGVATGHVAAITKIQPYGQLRNVSSPFPRSTSSTDSHPRSSSSSASSTTTATGPATRSTSSPFANPAGRHTSRSMPRTSSIDSAISTISTATSHSHKSSQDSYISNPADISYLINAAGSPEAVIQHLLKEKQHSTVQNSKLWKLVDKQRELLLGLNQDLERALKDKERYRRKLKEHLAQIPPVPSAAALPDPREASQSPTPGDLPENIPTHGYIRQETGLNDPHGHTVDAKTSNADPILVRNGTTGEVPIEMGQTNMRVENEHSRADPTSSTKTAWGTDDAVSTASESHRAVPLLDTKIDASQATVQGPNPVVSPSSFTAKRSQPLWQKSAATSSPALTASSPPGSSNETFMAQPRKLPPAPLDLRPPGREEVHRKPRFGPEDHSGSEYEDNLEVDEIIPAFDRGRKKTRAEDDQEREAAALKEKQDRSRSKKEKGVKTPSDTTKAKAGDVDLPVPPPVAPMSSAIKAVSPPTSLGGESNYLAAPPSLASVLTPPPTQSATIVKRTLLSAQPLSPGLPMSPRPVDRPMNSPMPRMPKDGAVLSIASPPLSPPAGFVGLPLSPRAAKQPVSFLPQTPMSITTPTPRHAEHSKDPSGSSLISSVKVDAPLSDTHLDPGPSVSRPSESTRPKGVYRGFVSDAYPELLIPPNALPSIIVKVISSRLKPSRNSYLANKASEEEHVFTLGVSARSDLQELWHVEKSLLSLPQLDQQLKQSSAFGAKLPDRALFSGHAPAKVDARKTALERYFDAILDTPMDENAALALCYYLSTQVVDPANDDLNDNVSASGSPVTFGPDGKLVKEGYLTKKGKNFGGWKARFFVLDEPILRYYESQGGSLLGTIKLPNSKIGKPSPHRPSDSPSRGEDHDGQYRHAFLILEPKRKDSSSHIHHTLCAENDVERDAWVEALLCYVEGSPGDEPGKKPSLSSTDSGSSKMNAPHRRPRKNDGSMTDSPQSETFDGLQTVSYDEAVSAQPPLVNMMHDKRFTESPSPTNLGGQHSAGTQKSLVSKTISGPSNGAKIQDVGAWGNKPLAPQPIDKEHKKRSIWGFHNKHPLENTAHSNDSSLSLTQQQYYERISNVRPAFGLQLADAVEYCSPRGIDVCLPAVVYRCLEYLKAHDAWSEEGIFRLSGSSVVIKGLRDRFNNEGDFDFLADDNYYDVHAVAGLLKLYLRELPSSVLTRELHLDFLHVLDLDEKSKKIAAFKVLVRRLPQANWTLIRALSEFLIGIVNNSNVNKMSVRNVCIVFSPTLNIHAPVFSTFITDFDSIFGIEYEPAPVPSFEMSVTEPFASEDFRPPRQISSDIPTPSYSQENFPQITHQRPYEQARQGSRFEHDIGFNPLQPSYEPPTSNPPPNNQGQRGQILMPGSDYGVISRKPSINNAAKSRRRESSMLLMGGGDGGMQPKFSVPAKRDDSLMVHEESAFH
ncbi:hypothetical protein MMC07_001609 [Pseudocyphellaria aurata]|nr:hypothetical protein [Pseudocyphellaria aurata]